MDIKMQIFLLYIFAISIISVIVTITDKVCAIKHCWRVKESTLFILSILGGSATMYITMLIIRHKTRKIKFMLGIPLIIAVQCIVLFFVWRNIYV